MRTIWIAFAAVVVTVFALAMYQTGSRGALKHAIAGAREKEPVLSTTPSPGLGTGGALDLTQAADPYAYTPSREASEKLALLREVLARLPEHQIPEMQLLTESDWYKAVEGPLETEHDFRNAFSKLRAAAEQRFAAHVQPALLRYTMEHSGAMPSDVVQLNSFMSGLDHSIIGRYRLSPADEFRNIGVGGEMVITQKSLVDSEYDFRIVIGARGYGAFNNRRPAP